MSRFCTGKMVILLDSSGNNPLKAKRISVDHHSSELLTDEGRPKTTLETLTETKSIKSRRNVRPIK